MYNKAQQRRSSPQRPSIAWHDTHTIITSCSRGRLCCCPTGVQVEVLLDVKDTRDTRVKTLTVSGRA